MTLLINSHFDAYSTHIATHMIISNIYIKLVKSLLSKREDVQRLKFAIAWTRVGISLVCWVNKDLLQDLIRSHLYIYIYIYIYKKEKRKRRWIEWKNHSVPVKRAVFYVNARGNRLLLRSSETRSPRVHRSRGSSSWSRSITRTRARTWSFEEGEKKEKKTYYRLLSFLPFFSFFLFFCFFHPLSYHFPHYTVTHQRAISLFDPTRLSFSFSDFILSHSRTELLAKTRILARHRRIRTTIRDKTW